MRIKSIMAYEFEELSEEVQKKVLNNMQDINVNYEWWDYTYEDAMNIGLKIDEFDLDRKSYVHGKFLHNAETVANNIIKDHGETCETVKTAKDYLQELQKLRTACPIDEDEYLIDTDDIDKEFLRSLCEDYRIILQKEYEYRLSDEAIKETIKDNEYEFTENGKLI